MGRKFINKIGIRYGNLVVLELYEKFPVTSWLCICDCGNKRIVYGKHLVNGDVLSCGCKNKATPRNAINEVGNRYGKLLVISRIPNKERKDEHGNTIKVNAYWECKCDCGRIINVEGRSLRSNTGTRCCGKCLPPDVAPFNNLYLRFRKSAEKRGYVWKLNKEQVKEITSQPCNYCGSLPKQISKGTSYRGNYIYNGIDRVDNTKGYEIDNVVPCCKICNYAKGTLSFDDFKLWVTHIYNNLLFKER